MVDCKRVLVAAAVVTAASCKKAEQKPPAAPPPPQAHKVSQIDSLQTPESFFWDSGRDVYFISNINGNPGVKDNNGFISLVVPDSGVRTLKFIEGGKNGVTLNAPKGLAVKGDTLWVTDIDAARAFNATTGRSIATIDLRPAGAVFLNDPAIGPDGALYITDTGIKFDSAGNATHPGPDRIFRIARGKVSVAAQGDTLQRPNGITWDVSGNRFIVVAFGGPSIFEWKLGDKNPTVIARGPGGFDGVEVARGKILVSSWTDSTVSAYQSGNEVKVISGVPSPADIGYDAKRNRVLIPVMSQNHGEVWQLP